MLKKSVRHSLTIFALTGAFIGASPTFAASWPDKPVRFVVNSAPGGTTDILGRLLANSVSGTLNATVLVENKAGAFGNIGAQTVARSSPDGYTFLFTPGGPLSQNRFLYKKLGFDPVQDFDPVITVAETPLVVAVNADSSLSSLADLAKAANTPSGVTISSPGNGSLGHLSVELLRHALKGNVTHVPYNGGGPASVALLGGQVDVAADAVGQYENMIRAGKVRALAVLSNTRIPSLPDVPTAKEQGYEDLVATVWFGVAAPKDTDAAVIGKLNAEIQTALGSEKVRELMASLSMQPVGGTPQDMQGRVSEEANVQWRDVIQRIGITLD